MDRAKVSSRPRVHRGREMPPWVGSGQEKDLAGGRCFTSPHLAAFQEPRSPFKLQLRLRISPPPLVPAPQESTELQHREARGSTLRNRPRDLERTLVQCGIWGLGRPRDLPWVVQPTPGSVGTPDCPPEPISKTSAKCELLL